MSLSVKQQRKILHKLKKYPPEAVAAMMKLSLDDITPYIQNTPEEKESVETDSLLHHPLKSWVLIHKKEIAALSAAVLLLYAFTTNFALVSDDIFGIMDRNLSDFSLVSANPLQFIKPFQYYLTHALFGITPWAYRLPNIISHLLVVVLVYALVETVVNKSAALYSALLVAVHPVMIESVTWISGGGHTNYTLFCLLSLLFYITKHKHRFNYWFSVVSFLIAILISEKAMMFPAIILLYMLLFENFKKSWRSLIPYSLISGIWVLQYAGMMSGRADYLESSFTSSREQLPPHIRVPISIGSYISLLLWPDRLTLYHTDMLFTPVQYAFMVLVTISTLGVGVLTSYFSKVKPWLKHVSFWVSVFIFTLLPTLVPGGLVWIVAERYAYFGAIALLITTGIIFDRLRKQFRRSDELMLLFCIIVIALSLRTFLRNLDWRDADHLYLSAERTSPFSAQNNNNLGDVYGKRGDVEKSLYYFTRATQLDPCYGDAFHNLANMYASVDQFDKAIENYNQAVKCKPILWQSHQQLAAIYYHLGDKDKARSEIAAALQINPSNQVLQQMQAAITDAEKP